MKHSPIGGISVSAIHRDTCNLRTKPSVRASVSGPLDHQASHVLGTIGEEDAAVHQSQAVLANTAARTLAPGDRLNSSWQKGTVISMVTATEKPANRLGKALANQLGKGCFNKRNF